MSKVACLVFALTTPEGKPHKDILLQFIFYKFSVNMILKKKKKKKTKEIL